MSTITVLLALAFLACAVGAAGVCVRLLERGVGLVPFLAVFYLASGFAMASVLVVCVAT